MKPIFRWIAIVAALLLLAVIALPFLIDVNEFRPRLDAELTKALGRDVKVGSLKLAILSGGVKADDLSIADDPAFSRDPFLRAKSLAVSVDLWPLIVSRKLNVTGITIDQPEIVLLQSAPGDWNFSKLGVKSAATPTSPASGQAGLDFSVKLVKISGGRLSIGKTAKHTKPLVLENVNVEVRDFSPASVMPFSLSAKVAGGGDVKIDGKAGPVDQDDVVLTPVNANVSVTNLNLSAAEVVDPASGIAGLVSLDGSEDSNGKRLEVKGKLKGEKMKLARGGSPARAPLEFDFTLDHDLLKGSGALQRGEIHIGKATANLTGTYARHGDSVTLNVNLSGPSMPIGELEAMLPALNIELPSGSSLQGGTASAKVNVEGPLDNLGASGLLSLNNTRLVGFDLGTKLSRLEKLAGIRGTPNTEIEIFSANVKTGQEGTAIEELKLVAPAIGELNGGGTVSPVHALDFKMRVTVRGSGVMITALGQRGEMTIPFFVRGTSSAPSVEPDVKGMAAQELNSVKGDAKKAVGGILNGILGKKN
jgi:AsmA protein